MTAAPWQTVVDRLAIESHNARHRARSLDEAYLTAPTRADRIRVVVEQNRYHLAADVLMRMAVDLVDEHTRAAP